MNTLNRRELLRAGSALGALALAAAPTFAATDMTLLNTPPEIGDMSLGDPNSKVTLIEYASASCPHCARFAMDVFPTLKKEYIDTNKIHFIFREFPLNDPALAASMIIRSLPKENYFPVTELVFRTQEKWVPNPLEGLKNIALQAGLTEDQFNKILKDNDLAKKIIAVRDQGEKLGVNGTPTFFLNGEVLDGEQKIEDLRAKIDALLK
jgi:protein-disulfide isomerase